MAENESYTLICLLLIVFKFILNISQFNTDTFVNVVFKNILRL